MKRVLTMAGMALGLGTLVLGAGCAGEPTLEEESSEVEGEIIRGKVSTKAQDAVVYLAIGNLGGCSGALVAPNLVLTARHCVAETDAIVGCSAKGVPINGSLVYEPHPAESLAVYTGRSNAALKLAARGKRVTYDPAFSLCNDDIAFIELDRPITGVPIAPLRLGGTRAGEKATAVGWGLNASGKLPSSRMQRPGVEILEVGPSKSVASAELLVGESVCSGDSGGPLLADSGAVIGVVSRGGNGVSDRAHPEKSCVGERARAVYTRVAAFGGLVERAFGHAGSEPKLE